MLRQVFLFLSRRQSLRRWTETSAVAGRFTRRFIAGQTLAECLTVAKRLRDSGFLSSLDHLGENVASAAEAELAKACYDEALRALAGLGIQATISVKLTQLGLDLGEDFCFAQARELCQLARNIGARVEFDMEASPYVDPTLRIVERLHEETSSARAVLQAYLHRAEADVRRMNRLGVPVRLCKGAYSEPASVAISDKAGVDRNYLKLTRLLMEEGADPAIATHDPAMISGALDFAAHAGRRPDQFEFQMLYGVRRDLQEQLLAGGYRIRLYVPYGDAWYPYFMRRLAERPANVLFIARNLLRR